MNIEPGKGVQQLNTANRNPDQISEAVYHKGRKVAPSPTEKQSQHSDHFPGKNSERRLSEYSIRSIDTDEGYISEAGSDIEEIAVQSSSLDISPRLIPFPLSNDESEQAILGYWTRRSAES